MVDIVKAEIVNEYGTDWVVERNTRYALSRRTTHPEEFLNKHCLECGFENPHVGYGEPTKSQMRERQLCFRCNFWTERLEKIGIIDDRMYIVVNGSMYSYNHNEPMVDKRKYRGALGYGGSEWWIYFPASDTRVKTNNLWDGGEIPMHFRDRIQNNATFLHVNSDGSYSHEWMDKY